MARNLSHFRTKTHELHTARNTLKFWQHLGLRSYIENLSVNAKFAEFIIHNIQRVCFI